MASGIYTEQTHIPAAPAVRFYTTQNMDKTEVQLNTITCDEMILNA